jgi:hypothetical protein
VFFIGKAAVLTTASIWGSAWIANAGRNGQRSKPIELHPVLCKNSYVSRLLVVSAFFPVIGDYPD